MNASNIVRTGFLVMLLTIASGAAQSTINSRAMADSWIGGGTLSMADGQQERLRCRAAYNVAGDGEPLRLNIRCASPSYNFDLASDVQSAGQRDLRFVERGQVILCCS